MTREKAIKIMQINRDGVANMSWSEDRTKTVAAFDMAIKALEQEPCDDAISRQAAIEKIHWLGLDNDTAIKCDLAIRALPSVNPQPKTGHCKDCKYFEYDSCAKVDGIPLILAHEICKRWGDGCKTWEDGYCFLFEPQESEEQV